MSLDIFGLPVLAVAENALVCACLQGNTRFCSFCGTFKLYKQISFFETYYQSVYVTIYDHDDYDDISSTVSRACGAKAASSPAAPASVPVWMAPCGRVPWSSSKGSRRCDDHVEFGDPDDSNVPMTVPGLLFLDGLESGDVWSFFFSSTMVLLHDLDAKKWRLWRYSATWNPHQAIASDLSFSGLRVGARRGHRQRCDECLRSRLWIDGGSMEHNGSRFYSLFTYLDMMN